MYLSFDIIFFNCTHTKSKDVTVSNLEIVNSVVKFICIKNTVSGFGRMAPQYKVLPYSKSVYQFVQATMD